MSVRSVITTVLRGEVDEVDQGTAHLDAMRQREADRLSMQTNLRKHAGAFHPKLPGAVKARAKRMK